jgi:hypothetical protein
MERVPASADRRRVAGGLLVRRRHHRWSAGTGRRGAGRARAGSCAGTSSRFDQGQAGAIDFDDCGWGHFLDDLAVTLSEVDGRARTPARRDGLLAGYRQVRPLPPGLDEHLPSFLALRELELTFWFVDQRSLPGFAEWEAEVDRGLDHLRALLTTSGPRA